MSFYFVDYLKMLSKKLISSINVKGNLRRKMNWRKKNGGKERKK